MYVNLTPKSCTALAVSHAESPKRIALIALNNLAAPNPTTVCCCSPMALSLPRASRRFTNPFFLNFPNLLPLSTSRTGSITSLSASPSSNFGDHYLIPSNQNPSGSPQNHLTFGFHTSIQGSTAQEEAFVEAHDMNPDAVHGLAAERICKILSNNRDSSAEVSLSNVSVDVSPELVVEVLKKLSNAGILALSFFRWAEKQKGFKYSTESYNALIEELGKIKQFKMIWNLVDDMKLRKLLTRDTFALVARRYARARKVKEAVETFEKMERYGMEPEVSDFNRLIDVLSKSKCVEKAQELFDKMKQRRLAPDVKSYTILLEGWGQQQNLLRLNEVYREMKDEGFEPDVVTYGIIINAHCKAKKYEEAIGFYHEMEAKNMRPTPHIYCTLIIGLGSDKRLEEALEFFEKSKASGFAPEAPTYNAVVGAYCWSMQMDDAYRMVDEMTKCGIGPNSRTYDIILHHLIKAQRTEEAYSVFQRMSSESGCEPTVSTYEIIARMFCNQERADMAMRVWDEMKAKGILPGMHMFSTLISALCHESKLDDACKYFQEMLDLGIRPPARMFSTLKQALIDEGRENTAKILALKIDKLRKTSLIA